MGGVTAAPADGPGRARLESCTQVMGPRGAAGDVAPGCCFGDLALLARRKFCVAAVPRPGLNSAVRQSVPSYDLALATPKPSPDPSCGCAQMSRTLEELVNKTEPALPLVMNWVASATNSVEVLPCDGDAKGDVLVHLQVSTRSPMGAIAHETGGILVDSGWVRVLGGGSDKLPRTIADWNQMSLGRTGRIAGAILVGDDVLGGFFALSGGGIPVSPGKVGYLAPDTLEWEDSDLGYTEWFRWLLTGDLQQYYDGPALAGLVGGRP